MESKIMTLYASYGILGHEKHPIYTVDGPCSQIYDEIKVKMPFETSFGQFDDMLIDVNRNNRPYLMREVLKTDKNGKPILVWTYGEKQYSRKLIIIE